MSSYISDAYSNTVFVTSDLDQVRSKLSSLLQTYQDSQGKFTDPDFGPSVSDPKGQSSIFFPANQVHQMYGPDFNMISGLSIDQITWLRPSQYCSDPCFLTINQDQQQDLSNFFQVQDRKGRASGWDRNSFKLFNAGKHQKRHQGASSLDVVQGNLGDCWFISALAIVALRTRLFGKILCNSQFHSYESKGIYVFKMFKNCRSHYVVVDDKIPCLGERGNYQPAFARCRNPNEFWVSLIEKAYAKLNSRYINLTGGFMQQALQDLTGLAPQKIRFNSETDLDNLWKALKVLFQENALIGASLNFIGRRDVSNEEKRSIQSEAQSMGIQYQHAYGVLDIRDFEFQNQRYQFVRLKNPWGSQNLMEWNGQWNDHDPKWTSEMRTAYNQAGRQNTHIDQDQLDHIWRKDDNVFIMKFEDFGMYFNQIMLVRDYSPQWTSARNFTKWEPSFGIPPKAPNWNRNPQFIFSARKETSMSIRLQQPDPRSFVDARPPFKKMTIIVCVLKLEQGENSITEFKKEAVALQSTGSDARSVSVSGQIQAGKYSIILLNTQEGVVSEAYLSLHFNCGEENIRFQDRGWEKIAQEEEGLSGVGHQLQRLGSHMLNRAMNNQGPDGLEKLVYSTGNPDLNRSDVKTPVEVDSVLKQEILGGLIQQTPVQEVQSFQSTGQSFQQNQIGFSYQLNPQTAFNLCNYGMDDSGLFQYFDQILLFPNLQALVLQGNWFTDYSVVELCNRLMHYPQPWLRFVDLSNNPYLTDAAGYSIYALTQSHQRIVEVKLEQTQVSQACIQNIMQVAYYNRMNA